VQVNVVFAIIVKEEALIRTIPGVEIMKHSISLLSIILFLFLNGCAEQPENLDEDTLSEHFSEIYVVPESNLYVDERGNPVNGEYVTVVSESSTKIRMEFEEGRIIEGTWTTDDGSEVAFYEQRDGFLVQNYYHENGRKSVEFIMNDEMHVVASNSWYIDGGRSTVMNRDSALTWHENGQLASRVYMKDGKAEGEGRGWHANGELASISHYKEDEWHGTFKSWDENGNLIEEKTYNMGMPEGVHKYWDKDGNLIEERAFEDGKPVSLSSED
jgi:antitoxin component YwqK of YwqJK toxin-antitoxin module